MSLVMVWTPIDRILWGIVILLFFICAIQYLNLGRRREDFNEKLISYSYSSIFFGLVFTVIFLLVSELLIPGTFRDLTFYGDYSKVDSLYKIMVKLMYFSIFGGFILCFYTFERLIKRTKYILTIFHSIILIFILILPLELVIILRLIYSGPFTIILISILLYYTKWSRLEFKAVSSLILLGSMLISYGASLTEEQVKQLNVIPLIISPVLVILGVFICLIPTIVNPNFFSKATKVWIMIGALNIGILIIFEVYFILYEYQPFIVYAGILWILMTLFSVFYTLKTIKFQIKSEKEEVFKDFLRVITRHQTITEEEVSISKEKKICLVCKGKVGGYNFICTECGTFYCEKCAKALTKMENACWGCNKPFDKSKPVKLPEKIEEKIEVSEKNFEKKNSLLEK